MFDRFTERARKVLVLAREEAKNYNHNYIGTEHILLGLIKEGQGVAAAVLQKLGFSLERIKLEIEKLVETGPSLVQVGEVEFTPKAKKVIELSMDEARKLGHNYVGTEHILLGLIREGEGVAAMVLQNSGLSLEKVKNEIMKLLGSAIFNMQSSETTGAGPGEKTKTPALDAFGTDLTNLAQEGKLDPVIGRDNEIERVLQILGRRTKNNPVLLGEAGVGKTAIVEGLAQRIVTGNIPEILRNKRIVVLDLALMIAGTKYRGQFEERIKAVLDELRKNENIITFIDELHTLVGAGAAEGAMDASNILKPALSRGEIQCIGATTFDEYRKNIEKDRALERRFQTITINPPSVEETIEILRGLRDRFEAHHRAKILDAALEAAARMSDRYITGRFLPDKAIDVIDEAGSKVRLAATVAPPNIKEIEGRINDIKSEKESAIKNQDFELAAKLRDSEKQVKGELDKVRKGWQDAKSELEAVVTENDVAMIVSKMTGVPLTELTEEETKRLVHMEEALKQRVIGQDQTIALVSKCVRRSRAGMVDPKRPIGSFLFLGPTGVGKTLLARALAEFMFGNPDSMIEIDMSEYMEKFAVSRLIGAPPGYVGYEEGGQLAEKVRRRPYSVILLDEIEKAHPDVFNILLQVLEDGRLTDSFGRIVSFKNTILIMTSNVGADLIKKQKTVGFSTNESDVDVHGKMRDMLMEEIKKVFRPEFLNRLDDVVVFRSLTRIDLAKIIQNEISYVSDRLKDKGIEIQLEKSALEFLIDKGYDDVYGARPLKRAIQKYLEDELSELILKGELKKGNKINVTSKKSKLHFHRS